MDERQEPGDRVPADAQPIGSASWSGARSSLIAQGVSQFGSVAATVVLARLLTPADFGLVALAQSIIAATTLLSLGGINAALVTRRGNLEPAASSYFWLAGLVGVTAVVAIALVAPPLVSALGQPDAATYITVLALTFPLNILGLIPNALLMRRMQITRMNLSIIIASLTYFVVEVVLAVLGFGAWSVVIGQLVGSAVGLMVSMVGAHWLPRPRISWRAVRPDLRTTWGLGLGQTVTYFHKNADYWATSAFIGGSALGVYYVAYVIPNIVRLRISAMVRQVMLPAYVASGSPEQMAGLWRRTAPVMVGLGIPALAGVALVADPLVLVFFGDQWESAVTPLRILTLAAAFDLFFASVGTVAIAQRQVRRLLRAILLRAMLTATLATLAAMTMGTIVSVASAVAVSSAVGFVVQELVVARPLGVGAWSVRGALAGATGSTGIMAAAVLAVAWLLPSGLPAALLLVLYVATGAVAYVGAARFLARDLLRGALRDVRRVVAGR